MVACKCTRNAGIVSVPGGGGATWTTIRRWDTGTNEWHAYWWKIAGASEPATCTFSTGGSSWGQGLMILRCANISPDALIEANLEGGRHSTKVAAAEKGVEVGIWMQSYNSTLQNHPDAGMLERAAYMTHSTDVGIWMGWAPIIEARDIGGNYYPTGDANYISWTRQNYYQA